MHAEALHNVINITRILKLNALTMYIWETFSPVFKYEAST